MNWKVPSNAGSPRFISSLGHGLLDESLVLFENGRPFDELAPSAAEYLQGKDIAIEVNLGTGGSHTATVWTCDLSAEYVKINAEYRT